MKNMENIMSVRLPEEDINLIDYFAKTNNKDKSTAVRELVEMGAVYFAIMQYSQGKISLGKAAGIADLTISEMMDLLANFGIKNKLEVIDYLDSKKTLK